MDTIEEVKKIEAAAKDLELSYDQKLVDMEKKAEQSLADMKAQMEKDLYDYQQSEEAANQEKLAKVREKLKQDTAQEIEALKQLYDSRKTKLVDIVIEEVIKQYGNS